MSCLVFNSRAEFDAFKATTTKTNGPKGGTAIGEPACETSLPNGAPAPGTRWLVEHEFSSDENVFLESKGVTPKCGKAGPDFDAKPADAVAVAAPIEEVVP